MQKWPTNSSGELSAETPTNLAKTFSCSLSPYPYLYPSLSPSPQLPSYPATRFPISLSALRPPARFEQFQLNHSRTPARMLFSATSSNFYYAGATLPPAIHPYFIPYPRNLLPAAPQDLLEFH